MNRDSRVSQFRDIENSNNACLESLLQVLLY